MAKLYTDITAKPDRAEIIGILSVYHGKLPYDRDRWIAMALEILLRIELAKIKE